MQGVQLNSQRPRFVVVGGRILARRLRIGPQVADAILASVAPSTVHQKRQLLLQIDDQYATST
ncbi:hypothetical protein C6P97_18450 [Burkholderia multivorans]|nr:hypothetical protein C6P97_18450 [Burkholderia multivorans]